MPKVNIHKGGSAAETPSEGIVKQSNAQQTVTDKDGRAIRIKKMNALDRMRLAEAVGADNSRNEVYFGYASLAMHVTEIDGDPVIQPRSKLALEGLVQRLGDEGLEAVALGVAEHFADPALMTDELRAALKNAQSTPS